MSGFMQGLLRWFGEQWCHLMHPDVTWPIHGQYRCRTCGRTYPVPWANTGTAKADVAAGKVQTRPAFGRVLVTAPQN
jgi:hypothetical protein